MKQFRQTKISNGVIMALVISSLSAIPVSAASNIEFRDIKGHWAESQISNFLNKGYVNGYGDDTFRPDNKITRAEFIKIVNMAFGYTAKGSENFKDVNQNDWFYEEVLKAVGEGYIQGYGDDTFRPNEPISRAEACKIVGVILKANGAGDTTFKDDSDIEAWAKTYVKGLVDMGIIDGFKEDNTFRPNANTSRAETVKTVKAATDYSTPGGGGGSGSQVDLNPTITSAQQINDLKVGTKYTSITINTNESVELKGITATTVNVISGDVTLKDCNITTLNIGVTTRARSSANISIRVIYSGELSYKLANVNINSVAIVEIDENISIDNLVVGEKAGGTEIKGDGKILNAKVNSDITSEIAFTNSGEAIVELVTVIRNLEVEVAGDSILVNAVARNYSADDDIKVELIGEGITKESESTIGEGGIITHTFGGLANGTYTVRVTVGTATVNSKQFEINVEQVEQVDKLSEYGFEFILPENVIEDTEYDVDMTLKATTINQLGYDNALIKVEVTTPYGEKVNLLATDTNGNEWDIASVGQWGPAGGFKISRDYSATTPVKAKFSAAGEYSIKLILADLADSDKVIASDTINVSVVEK